ncbi:hypothetical protein [Aureimonas sp. SA4125]|uniref:hypothetical protein n=1 Tax=Aureimonas sp. SA4125 TaxID=2826993 RepID=UPI001CC35CC0|nr:hypothetical protein [Aureimonas sp. SA4125]
MRHQPDATSITIACGTFALLFLFDDRSNRRAAMFKGGLMWLIGIPIPIILILWFAGYL